MGPFIWTDLNPLNPKIIFAKFGCSRPNSSGRIFFLISSMNFSLLRNYLPLEKVLCLNKLHLWTIYAMFGWNWHTASGKEDFFQIRQCIFASSLLSPLWEERGTLFQQTFILFTQGWFVPSLTEIGQVVLEKKVFKIRQCIFAIS